MREAFTSIEMAFGDRFEGCGVSRKTLSLGILAHVDAGKTTLTERLLSTSGVIDRDRFAAAGAAAAHHDQVRRCHLPADVVRQDRTVA